MKNLILIIILLSNLPVHTYNCPSDRRDAKTRSWGAHTMIDLHKCSYSIVRSTWDMNAFIQRVCSFIGVTQLGSPNTIYHQSGYGYTSGYTAMQHANGHTDIVVRVNEHNDNVFVDVFSCKAYEPHQLANLAQDFFGACEATVDILYRR